MWFALKLPTNVLKTIFSHKLFMTLSLQSWSWLRIAEIFSLLKMDKGIVVVHILPLLWA